MWRRDHQPACLHRAFNGGDIADQPPFGVFHLAADEVGASGVLAVLVAGLFLRATMSGEITPAGWLLGRSVWEYVDFAVSGLLFAFLGIELTSVLENATLLGDGGTLGLAAAVIGVLVASRTVAMFAASALAGRRARSGGVPVPYGWRESAVASWAGMRGVVTVATALALPVVVDDGSAFPDRESVLLVALLVVIVTLVVQGLTLAPLIRRLGVGADEDESAETRELARRAAQAGLEAVLRAEGVPADIRETVAAQYESRLRHRGRVQDLVADEATGAKTAEALRSLSARAAEAEREVVLEARHSGEASPATADRVLYGIEARARQQEW